MNWHVVPDEAIHQFAKEISLFLESEKLKKHFDSLTIVVEPHLLGKIRAEMKENMQSVVLDWIKKDLQKTPQKELVEFLLPSGKLSALSASLHAQ